MCLIAWNWQPDSDTPLLLLSNRDEFYQRATRPLQWWDDGQILAGQDLQAGGTWLGVSRSGRLAALTNVRAPGMRDNTPSRGELVANFLHGAQDGAAFLQNLASQVADYNPFNLLVFDGRSLVGLHSPTGQIQALPAGIGGVSNAAFDTPWPKLQKLKSGLAQQLQGPVPDEPDLLPLLADTSIPSDDALPHTGLPLALERGLSPAFIHLPAHGGGYGTRASSLVRVGHTEVMFTEHSFGENGLLGQVQQRFTL